MLFGAHMVLLMWLVGITSVALLAGGVWLVWAWFAGLVVEALALISGAALICTALLGRWIVLLVIPHRGTKRAVDLPPAGLCRVSRPDGAELAVEIIGDDSKPSIVLIHGWGAQRSAWYEVAASLAERYRLVMWDLAGLGESRGPHQANYSLEKMAGDLRAVLELCGREKALVVGHSLGGTLPLTMARLWPDEFKERVSGLVLVGAPWMNPLRTTTGAPVLLALQKPVIEPLLKLTVGIAPLVRAMNWLSYLNGSMHLSAFGTGFSGAQSRGQLDFAARLLPEASPAVVARGSLAALYSDETASLRTLGVPALVVTGHIDRVMIPDASRDMAQLIPHARLAMIEPAGHMVPLEGGRQLAEMIAAFGQDCFATSSSQVRMPTNPDGNEDNGAADDSVLELSRARRH